MASTEPVTKVAADQTKSITVQDAKGRKMTFMPGDGPATFRNNLAPYRGLSAYMFFANENRDRVRSENPDAVFGQIGKLLGDSWKSLSDEGKAKYLKQAEEDKARYEREKAAFDAALPLLRAEDGETTPVNDNTNLPSADAVNSMKVLYEGPSKCNCCFNWVEEPPADFEVRVEDRDENKRYALLVRKRKNHGDEGKQLLVDSIVIQSDELKEMLTEVFRNYRGIDTFLRKLVFKPPFNQFFFEWDRFNAICEAQKEPVRAQAMLLRDVVEEELAETIATTEDLARNKVVTFDYLWTVLRVGMDVHSSQQGYDCIYKLAGANYRHMNGDSYFELEVHYVNFDGKEYGWETTNLFIWEFSGTKSISELDVVLVPLLPTIDSLQAKVIARGAAFREYTQPKYHYAAYKGLAKDTMDKKFSVDGRIVVDESAFAMFNSRSRPKLKPIEFVATKEYLHVAETIHHRSRSSSRSMSPPVVIERRSRRRSRRRYADSASSRSTSRVMPEREQQRPNLDDDLLRYCCPEVRGYCLKTKQWATFAVDDIRQIRWNSHAFDNLVMAPDLKRMILSFVETQAGGKDSFDDIIEGKGRGIILLLEGSPGVGKTLTAEAVADRLGRPLYAISGGELGHDAFELERSLQMILDIAAKWDGVLLLDECDIFLEKRNADNMRRNGIVAVFLRTLEYYNGILFMTTNRVNAIDPAFQSRIHLTIQYPDLDFHARKQIWKHFLDISCSESKMTMRDVQELAEDEFNGREIKNLIKTAQLLARHEKVPLNMVHVKTVLGVMKRKPTVGIKDAI